jgi:tetratricopeptide (TPR) repeat protein
VALSFVHTVARFRLFVVPYFLIYAGVFLTVLVRQARARPRAAAAGLAGLALGGGLQALAPDDLTYTVPRPSDYFTASALSLREADYALALKVAEDAGRHEPGNGAYFANLAARHERDGHPDRAIEYYRRALEIDPGLRAARQGLERLLEPGRASP